MLMESGTRCHRVTLPKREPEPEPELEPELKRLKSEQEPKLTSETNDPEESDDDESDSDESDSEFIKDYKRREAADKVYREESRKLSPYDAIPRPRRSLLCGGRPVRPLEITERNLPDLQRLSNFALDYYNKGSGASFEFDHVVKCTFNVNFRAYVRHITTLYITFKAKGKEDPSDSPGAIKIFQAKVVVDELDKDKDPSVEECKIKIE